MRTFILKYMLSRGYNWSPVAKYLKFSSIFRNRSLYTGKILISTFESLKLAKICSNVFILLVGIKLYFLLSFLIPERKLVVSCFSVITSL